MAGGARPEKRKEREASRRFIARNRKATFKFEVLDRVEAGIALRGTEVKTLRTGTVSLEEAYVKIEGEEAFLVGAHIEEYAFGNRLNHEPKRRRKLLLHRREVSKWAVKASEKGYTVVPLALYFNERNLAKLEVALCRGKKLHDKRADERKKEDRAEITRQLRRR
jgi:SsrA-binding protein